MFDLRAFGAKPHERCSDFTRSTLMQPLWTPSEQRIENANITAFRRALEQRHGVALDDYRRLWQWSIDYKWDFWRAVWDDGGVIGSPGERVLDTADLMPGATWLPDARLNFAQNLLERRRADDKPRPPQPPHQPPPPLFKELRAYEMRSSLVG